MQISPKYNPRDVEDKWYKYWIEKDFFTSVPDQREPYTIVIPPPNVTGVLHMGHMLNNTIQDVLIRRARMQGKNACWVPGTDHASIATEAKVVNMLKEKGIEKRDITRDEFLKYAWEWKEKHGGIILEQLKKLGASCDWSRTRFTMDQDMSAAVIQVFVDLHNKGQIYRGVRMVNWDPQGMTAVSDEEVIYKEINSKLYYVNYKIEGEENYITIATTRPETILGDTAICVNPADERYKNLKNKKALVPLINRSVPIIFDEYVAMDFGTGALKVTPAHDINDYNLGLKYKLEIVDVINLNGTMSDAAQLYVGEDRFTVRKKIVKELEEQGHLVKVEDIKNKVGFSERTNAVIEPKLSLQWFLKMKDLAEPALKNVLEGEIKLIPEKYKNTYRAWMENVHDWCISRQLWWGQRIPAFYLNNGEYIVAETREKALELAKQKTKNIQLTLDDLRQDEDVLDTWFSSWLWPISVFDGLKDPDNPDIKYYYPTNDLVTAPEILFFWVARMIMAGYEYRNEKPFKTVYLTGIVRDKLGRKMSKSLGNSPDPIDLIDKYSADGVRVGMLLSSPAGNDLLFDENLCEQGRNFSNKIWNAFRLIKGWSTDEEIQQPVNSRIAVEWFTAKFYKELDSINNHYLKYRISDALMSTYKLVWDDFCSWYLEMIKPDFGAPVDPVTYNSTINIFENLLKILHPFMPFIAEEIWHLLKERKDKECIIVAEWPVAKTLSSYQISLLNTFQKTSEIITSIRSIRKEKNIHNKEKVSLYIKLNEKDADNSFDGIIAKLCNLDKIEYELKNIENAITFRVGVLEFFIPVSGKVDFETEKARLIKELEYQQGFLKSVQLKLNNKNFITNAKPEIIANEQKKKDSAEAKIKIIEEQLSNLAINS